MTYRYISYLPEAVLVYLCNITVNCSQRLYRLIVNIIVFGGYVKCARFAIVSPDNKCSVVYHSVSSLSVATMIVGAYSCLFVLD